MTSRPWKADEYLHATVQTLVFNRGSPCKLIEYSECHKLAFNKFVQKMPIDALHDSVTRIVDLQSSKVRFDSCTRPMGRFILLLDPLIETLVSISITRAGRKEAKESLDALEFLDSERIMCLAMCADAGDESLIVTRFYDTGTFDPALHQEQLADFRARIDFLFVAGHCFDYGFTREARIRLRRVRTLCLRGATKSIGGDVDNTLKERCLKRFRCWVWLATATINAEFPQWDLLSCFAIFNVAQLASGGSTPTFSKVFERLGHFFGIDPSTCRAELSRP